MEFLKKNGGQKHGHFESKFGIRPISGVIFSLKIGLFAKPQYEISRSLRLENSEGYLSP